MTWPDGIAGAVLTAFALLTVTDQHKHRSTTQAQHTRRTENRHGHQRPQNDTGQESGSQAPGEEDTSPQTRC